MRDLYPSKLMLFGEYAVIAGGEGLAVPWDDFYAQWIEESETESAFKPHLLRFCEWLRSEKFVPMLDVDQFMDDLHHGLDIESNIPIGYGVGSSGAGVAAVYDRYARDKSGDHDLPALKQRLASMENFFHAKSSGLDPLVCYLQEAIHITPEAIHVVQLPQNVEELPMRLLDCGYARATHALVNTFSKLMERADFKVAMQDYIQYSNACIRDVLQNDMSQFMQHVRAVSDWQWHYFDFAIPEQLRKEWHDALRTENAAYKLCGAGGGGFMLIFHTTS